MMSANSAQLDRRNTLHNSEKTITRPYKQLNLDKLFCWRKICLKVLKQECQKILRLNLKSSASDKNKMEKQIIMNSTKKLFIASLAICACAFSSAHATPMIWESDFGAEMVELTFEDDEQSTVTLSFDFEFAGVNYTEFFVGTNGAVQAANGLSEAGEDDEIDTDLWFDMAEFLDDGTPIFSPFNSDLDLSTTGTIHFNDFGDRAVFTWNEIGTNEEEEHLLTFQMQLLNDGSIIFAYNGLFDNVGEDFLTSLDEGILVGISESNDPQGLTPSDLNGGPFTTGTSAFELWCYDVVNSCDGFNGPLNSAFDLDQTNIIFTPRGVGNFDVTSLSANQIPNPGSITLLGLGLLGLVARRRI